MTTVAQCSHCGQSLRSPLPAEPDEGVLDAEYRVIPEKHWTDAIWTKDTFLGKPKWLRVLTPRKGKIHDKV